MYDVYAMRILLTLSVTVAGGARSFSKVKLIKTNLRTTVSDERLTSLKASHTPEASVRWIKTSLRQSPLRLHNMFHELSASR